MKKKIFGGLFVLAIAAVAAFNVNMNSENDQLSLLSLANVEALAEEAPRTKCPDENYVPNRFIKSEGVETATYTSNKNGEITVLGEVIGGYKKFDEVIVSVETFNCDGEEEGACCDQRKVGTSRI